jgi:penicillin amidase
MRYIPLFIAACFSGALFWFFNTPISTGSAQLPPLGPFFNPYSGFWKNAEPVNVLPNGAQSLPGLKGKVEVVFDDLMIPHIFAEHPEDAFRVQGYIIARHRLWQMDITARQTAGRLSEVFGARTLEIDRLVRRRGLPYAAELDWKVWQQADTTRKMIEAYTEGVNAWIEQMRPADYPIEYKLLHYKPERWTPVKTALIIENMIDALNDRDNDMASTIALSVFGRDTFDYLYPLRFEKNVPVVPDTGQWRTQSSRYEPDKSGPIRSLTESVAPAERALPGSFQHLNGSNNWVLAGSRTKSGAPILCNDMHLPLRLPHVWYQLQIHTPHQNIYGVIVPGVPGIVVGFNESIAWGFTNVSQDVADWYRIDWVDAQRTRYRLDGKEQVARFRIETISVKGSKDIVDTVRYTVWGPVVYDDPGHPLFNYAYRYSTHDEPGEKDLERFFKISEAKSYSDYRTAIPGLGSLSQNVAFASRDGDIAITVQGLFPVRRYEQGRFLQDGSQSENACSGYIPMEELPTLKNPSRGFIFSANQVSTDPGFPYFYLGNFDDYRGRRIFDRLKDIREATVDSMISLQTDSYSKKPADALPVMLRLVQREKLEASQRDLLKKLEQWDYVYARDGVAPSLFEMWFDTTYLRTWDELDILRKRNQKVLFPESWRFTEMLDKDPGSVFFDHPGTKVKETASDIVTASFRAVAERVATMPLDSLVWKKYKGFAIRHIARLDGFSRLDVATDGVRHAPNATGSDHGPSWKMIVELTQPVRAWGVYPGGQSGNPGSPYFDNMVDAWADGTYYELLLLDKPTSRPSGRRKVVSTITFTPVSQ